MSKSASHNLSCVSGGPRPCGRTSCQARSRSARRKAEVQKSWDEYYNRLQKASWQENPSKDWSLRLRALALLGSARSERQLFNLAKLNLYASSREPITILPVEPVPSPDAADAASTESFCIENFNTAFEEETV